MISSFRNFAKTKLAWLLVSIIIIPFVFWGMGSMFSGGNVNNVAKINKTNISTQEFIQYLNDSKIPQKTLRENLENNIIEELLSNLISTTLLDLEVKDYRLILSETILLKKIKENKNFRDENNNFQRLKYEKFLLENNISAPIFEQRLKKRELQKKLFDYVGAGTVSPKFLIKKLYEEENKKLEVEFINLNKFYKKKDDIDNIELENFIENNKDQLKIEYLDFEYVIINPKNLFGNEEFNQAFFDKIDQIEIDISNEIDFQKIVFDLDIPSTVVKNFRFSSEKNEIEKKIFELRKNRFDIFENGNDFILYKVDKIDQRKPDLKDDKIKKEIIELVTRKNKFDYNRKLLEKIQNKQFNQNDFLNMAKDKSKLITLNSIKDNKKFEINSVEILYSLPINSFTLISDDKENIYLAKIKNYRKETININDDAFKEYSNKHQSSSKSTLLKTYDLFLNKKYDVVLNEKTLDRVKYSFQ